MANLGKLILNEKMATVYYAFGPDANVVEIEESNDDSHKFLSDIDVGSTPILQKENGDQINLLIQEIKAAL